MTKVPPWSYSSLTKFETCPRQYYLTRVSKEVKDSPGEHAIWGDKVHRALEDRVLKKQPLPEGMQHWERIASKFDTPKGRVFTETRLTLTRNLNPTDWMAKDAWVRGIIDLGVDAGPNVVLFDWKTGKVKHDNDQLRLFAGLYFAAKPYVQKIKTAFIWLQHNKLTRERFTRDDAPSIWEGFVRRSDALAEAYEVNRWPAKKSGLCRGWCPATRRHCEFSERS